MKNFPLFCPKCKKETLIDVKNSTVTVHKDFFWKMIGSFSEHLDFLSKNAYNLS